MTATVLQTPSDAARWLRERVTGALHTDSRQVQPGDGFIAWPGARTDGRRFAAAALAAGAAACVLERAGTAHMNGLPQSPRIRLYDDLKPACGAIASLYYGQPSQHLQLLAVTGTNGKTSTAWWLAAALDALSRPKLAPCALVGTLGAGQLGALQDTGLTTPDPVLLQARLADFVRAGVRSCALEASSIGLAEHRLAGSQIALAIFTNFTRDHLDYHHDMAAYWQAKRALFDWPSLRAAVINIDDAKGADLAAELEGRALDLWTVSLRGAPQARLRADTLLRDASGSLRWQVQEGRQEGAPSTPVTTSFFAEHDAANLMGVLGALRALGIPLADAAAACAALPAVPGRMERVHVTGAPLAVIDFAHTPDALQHALHALRPLAQQRGGKLWCVFGCGGNRDASKRPLMAAEAERAADMLVITSDNPRDEDPLAIIAQMRRGLARPAAAQIEPDRAQAIAQTLRDKAAAQDVVLIAGKGHETFQEVGGRKIPFVDREHAARALRARTAPKVQA